jgi:GDP-L-fucose synthase
MRVVLTGGGGMLGTSIARSWHARRPHDELVVLTRDDVDLTDRAATTDAIARLAPDAVVHAAAKVGGISAKVAQPVPYLLDNLLIDTSVLSGAIAAGVPELLYVSSGAVYPQDVAQPIAESTILTGVLESANEGYAIAKIAGGALCEYASRQFGYAYRAVAPSNLYGPYDDYSPGRAHLIASAIAKIHQAMESGSDAVEIWGDGTARREFTYVADLADWLVGQIGRLDAWPALVNAGCGIDHSIAEYYEAAARVMGYEGRFEFDPSKTAGVPQRLLDSSTARGLGWAPMTTLDAGIAASYSAFLTSHTVDPEF